MHTYFISSHKSIYLKFDIVLKLYIFAVFSLFTGVQ